jgi:L-fuculose-phosphate aldolase
VADGELIEALTRIGRTVVRAGLVVGSGGNLSAREPGSPVIRVSGAGTWLDRLDAASLPKSPWSAPTPAVTTEFALHRAVYRSRPEINAVIHLHPQITVLLDTLGERIRLITTDHAFYIGRVAVTPFHPPGTEELADAVAEAVADGTNCVVLAHHGCAVIAESAELALRRALNLEEAARLTYQALLLGRPIVECPAVSSV